MWNKIKQHFKSLLNYPKELDDPPPDKTLENLELLDDVWIEKDGKIKRAWVWEITKRTITVVFYDSIEILKIHYERPLNVSIIKDENITMYLNYARIYSLH